MSGPEEQSLLFEISWEACRKVGGIYTVLRSKAPTVVSRWGDRYCLIGPYVPETAAVEFDPLEPGEILGPTLRTLRERGFPVHFGRWLISGSPKVILLDYSRMFHAINDWKRQLWEACQIGIPDGDTESDEAVVFGSMVVEFFQELVNQTRGQQKMIAHFHEWMASLALPMMRHRQLPVSTVFTTHATLLGRYLCASDVDFYSRLNAMNPDQEAGRLNMHHRYAIERAGAHSAHVFTTVSEVTADEAEIILGRRADVIVPNGLEVKRFAALHEFQNLHRQYKDQIHEFVRGHFFGSYSFDLDKTLYMFIAGRYEYRNKGIDLFLEALHRLNYRLQQTGSDTTVVAFLVAPAATRSVHVEVLKSRFMLAELRKTCERVEQELGERIYQAAASGELPDPERLLTESDVVRLKRMIYSRRQTGLPPVVTHDMVDDNRDPILNHVRHRGLFNSPNDRVKVVYHPEFIVSTNPLFGIDYEEFVRGCHLGVFPSYYEPWGYTPAECTVMGVPSVCSNLSGFAAYMQGKVENHEHSGIYVVDRRYVGTDESINQLSDILYRFSQLGRRERIAMRNRTERLSDLLDWSSLYPAYTKAHELALHRMWPS